MDAAVYAVEAAVEETHWWFAGRRRLFATELARAGIPKDAHILDIGTGTGSTLRMLRDQGYTRVTGIDASDEALRFCAEKGIGRVRKGDICALPFPDASFDFIFATDVLEHVEDDRAAASQIARVLTPNGKALITVPAFMQLWGLQDRRAGHKRRYRMCEFLNVLHAGGLDYVHCFYFNYLLFVPILLCRRAIKIAKIEVDSEASLNTSLTNRVLNAIFALDISTAPRIRPPFGVSIFVLARKLS